MHTRAHSIDDGEGDGDFNLSYGCNNDDDDNNSVID